MDPVTGLPLRESLPRQSRAAKMWLLSWRLLVLILGRVVKTTCFLADMADFAVFNEVYARYFTGKPARSCVAAKILPKGLLCEIEAVAEL